MGPRRWQHLFWRSAEAIHRLCMIWTVLWAHLERELICNGNRTGTGTEKNQFPFLGSGVPSLMGTDLERTGTGLERIFWPNSVGSNQRNRSNTYFFNTKFCFNIEYQYIL